MKNYIGFVNDHSGSMVSLKKAALKDYNANIQAVKEAANREMLDTIVSVVAVGVGVGGVKCERQITISNPHVLKPVTSWLTSGGTPLYDGIGNIIELFESLPDYSSPNVSFLVLITTDGAERDSKIYNKYSLTDKIKTLQNTDRWTFVFRVPKGCSNAVRDLGVPLDNIQEWETTSAGMEVSTLATAQAMNEFYFQRAAGKKSSSVFYANAASVTAAAVKTTLQDISTEVSMWTVMPEENGEEILPFSQKRLGPVPFLKGAAFYQLTKTEARVQENKLILIRDKVTGHVYYGNAARDMIGLPQTGTVRLHPGDHGNYDIFIQSTSINRKLVQGTQVLYWPKMGVGFTSVDFPWLTNGQNVTPEQQAKVQTVIQATSGIKPIVTNKPTVSPLTNSKYFPSRDEARIAARAAGKTLKDAGVTSSKGKRWYI